MSRRIVCLAFLAVSFAPGQTKELAASKAVRVLFVGNSYTYYNDLPWVVSKLGRALKPPRILQTSAATRGGATLEWHWGDDGTKKTIASKPWDWVVLQEQSQRPILDRAAMLEHARNLNGLIAKRRAKTMLYMTWARQHIPAMQKELTASYRAVAKDLKATVAPVGIAWAAVRKAHPGLALHDADRSHPNQKGTYLAACVFLAKLTGANPVGLPSALSKDGEQKLRIDAKTAKILQQAARDATRAKQR